MTTAVLTVDIQDTNDEIPQITGQFTITIDEEQPADTEIPIAFTVVDTDAADTNALTYSITGAFHDITVYSNVIFISESYRISR